MASINTNVGAMVALQNLNATSSQLQMTQTIISTGLKVASAKDDGATWAIAQNQRATASSLDAVKDSMNRASSVTDYLPAEGAPNRCGPRSGAIASLRVRPVRRAVPWRKVANDRLSPCESPRSPTMRSVP